MCHLWHTLYDLRKLILSVEMAHKIFGWIFRFNHMINLKTTSKNHFQISISDFSVCFSRIFRMCFRQTQRQYDYFCDQNNVEISIQWKHKFPTDAFYQRKFDENRTKYTTEKTRNWFIDNCKVYLFIENMDKRAKYKKNSSVCLWFDCTVTYSL